MAVEQKDFRILKKWKIKWEFSRTDEGYCFIDEKKKKATIYMFNWDDTSNPHPDFELHELLHVALRALSLMDKRKPKEMIQAEELLVQDICRIYDRRTQ